MSIKILYLPKRTSGYAPDEDMYKLSTLVFLVSSIHRF